MDSTLNTTILESLILDSYQDLFSIIESIMEIKRCENAYKLDMKSIVENSNTDLADGRTERYNSDKATLIEKAKQKISEFLKYIRDKVVEFFNLFINFLKKSINSDKKLISKYKDCKSITSVKGFKYTITEVLQSTSEAISQFEDTHINTNGTLLCDDDVFKFRNKIVQEATNKDEFETGVYKALRSNKTTTEDITGTVGDFCKALDYEVDIKTIYNLVSASKSIFEPKNAKFLLYEMTDERLTKSLEVINEIRNSLIFTLNACKNAINERNTMIRQAIIDGVRDKENLNESYNICEDDCIVTEGAVVLDKLLTLFEKPKEFISNKKILLYHASEYDIKSNELVPMAVNVGATRFSTPRWSTFFWDSEEHALKWMVFKILCDCNLLHGVAYIGLNEKIVLGHDDKNIINKVLSKNLYGYIYTCELNTRDIEVGSNRSIPEFTVSKSVDIKNKKKIKLTKELINKYCVIYHTEDEYMFHTEMTYKDETKSRDSWLLNNVILNDLRDRYGIIINKAISSGFLRRGEDDLKQFRKIINYSVKHDVFNLMESTNEYGEIKEIAESFISDNVDIYESVLDKYDIDEVLESDLGIEYHITEAYINNIKLNGILNEGFINKKSDSKEYDKSVNIDDIKAEQKQADEIFKKSVNVYGISKFCKHSRYLSNICKIEKPYEFIKSYDIYYGTEFYNIDKKTLDKFKNTILNLSKDMKYHTWEFIYDKELEGWAHLILSKIDSSILVAKNDRLEESFISVLDEEPNEIDKILESFSMKNDEILFEDTSNFKEKITKVLNKIIQFFRNLKDKVLVFIKKNIKQSREKVIDDRNKAEKIINKDNQSDNKDENESDSKPKSNTSNSEYKSEIFVSVSMNSINQFDKFLNIYVSSICKKLEDADKYTEVSYIKNKFRPDSFHKEAPKILDELEKDMFEYTPKSSDVRGGFIQKEKISTLYNAINEKLEMYEKQLKKYDDILNKYLTKTNRLLNSMTMTETSESDEDINTMLYVIISRFSKFQCNALQMIIISYKNTISIMNELTGMLNNDLRNGINKVDESFTSVLDEEEFIYESVLDNDDTFVSVLDM